MSKIILASHGQLSKGMLDSIQMVVGDLANDVKTYSLYPGENPNDYVNMMKESIQNDLDSYLIICDIKGGSVYNAFITLCVLPNVTVISGMNMNLVLELVLSSKDEEASLITALENAKAGITMMNQSLLKANDEESDF